MAINDDLVKQTNESMQKEEGSEFVTLKRFALQRETGQVVSEDDVDVIPFFSRGIYAYKWVDTVGFHKVKHDCLDTLIRDRVYSFNCTIEQVREIVKRDIAAREKAYFEKSCSLQRFA